VQVVSNVLSNAAKYTQNNGDINLSLSTYIDQAVIIVSDNGIGFNPEDKESLFELFTQAKRSADRSQGGLGLGLALVKNIVRLHDGTVSCNSEGLGLGSQFTITFPLHSNGLPNAD
jgi:signal transduction histidine kinase